MLIKGRKIKLGMCYFSDFDGSSDGGGVGGGNDSGAGSGSDSTSTFSIPEEYADKGWAKVFEGKTGDDLKTEFFKSYDNSQSMIGKKVQDYLSTTDLKQLDNYEDIKKNLQSQLVPEYQVPENASDYALQDALKNENGEQIFSVPEEALGSFSEKFKEFGISKEQAHSLVKTYLNYETEQFNKYTDAEELETNINKMFSGNSQQRTTCEGLIKEFLSPQDQKFLQDTMPNVVIEMFYKLSKGLVDKYGYKEGNAGGNNSGRGMTEAEKNTQYNDLVSKLEALKTRPHTDAEERDLINQIQNVWK